MAELVKVKEANGERRANAVFVHGLGGDAYGTWQATEDRSSFWPLWIAEDIEGLSVYSVGYEAAVSRWRGAAMHLTDRSANVLECLLAEPSLGDGPLILIGHSLGGLVIKQLLRTAECEARKRGDAANFLRRVEKVAFLATPHTGSDLAVWGDRLRILVWPSAATASLVRNDPNLGDLNLWYRGWANDRKIGHLVLTETRPFGPLGMIVKPDSSDPGLSCRPVPTDCDHVAISKPTGRESEVYVQVRKFIEIELEKPKDLLLAIEGKLDRLPELVVAPINERLDAIATLVAREKRVEAAPLRAVLAKLGEAGVKDEDIPKRLDEKADELIKLRAENEFLRCGPPALAAIAEEVQALIDKGDFDAARRELARGRDTSRALRVDASRNEAAFLAQEARLYDLALAYRSAAEKYSEAASLVAPFDKAREWLFQMARAAVLYKQGDEFGDNDALVEAIDIYHQSLALVPLPERPFDWAATQHYLGNALGRLGELESGETKKYEEAVQAYNQALLVRAHGGQPFDRAETLTGLGIALWRIGERTSPVDFLLKAADALSAAAGGYPLKRMPVKWAWAQMNLGNVFRALNERMMGEGYLEKAIDAYSSAVEGYKIEYMPREWAHADNNLGTALSDFGYRERNKDYLLRAIKAFRAALTIFSRSRAPLDWAMVKNNLGVAFERLGVIEKDPKQVVDAIECFHEALKERQQTRVPLDWAMTQSNLGNALLTLGSMQGETELLEKAVIAFRSSLTERTRERAPSQWAATKANLGLALLELGKREMGTSRLFEAIATIHESLEEYSREVTAVLWAQLQTNIASAYWEIFARDNAVAYLDNALEAIDGALEEFRKMSIEFDIGRAEHLRARIVEAKGMQ